MALNIQYNKTFLTGLTKQLKVRQRALPTLKNKESALRLEVKKARDYASELEVKLNERLAELERISRLWPEFEPELLQVTNVEISVRKIAGVKIPVMGQVDFELQKFSLFSNYEWFADGIAILKELTALSIEREFYLRKMRLLDFARKKTTQKVNLYEKVQIPSYEDGIRKIKRFMEDEENLSKSGQKILKGRAQAVAGDV